MRIAIGCDENAYEMKEAIKAHLKERGVEFEDMGCDKGETVLYPEIARRVAVSIMEGKFDRGILICGTGLGMAIVANKIPGVRAATCHDVYSAERARKSNNACPDYYLWRAGDWECPGDEIIGCLAGFRVRRRPFQAESGLNRRNRPGVSQALTVKKGGLFNEKRTTSKVRM